MRGAVARENLLGRILFEVRDGEQQVLGGDILILEVGSLFEGLLQQLVGGVRERGLRRFSGNFWEFLDVTVEIAENRLRADADLFEHRGNDALFVFEKGGEKVNR